jgi:hypothetical protein
MATKRISKKALAEAIGGLDKWAKQCHAASLALVRTGLLGPEARVARGRHVAIMSQHSWVVIGDPYCRSSKIIDPTLASWVGKKPEITIHQHGNPGYFPKGGGQINMTELILALRNWSAAGTAIHLAVGTSAKAREFIKHITPPRGMTLHCWGVLASSPVGGWPAKEIISAMLDHDRLKALVPIDVEGMLTDRNPGELYR